MDKLWAVFGKVILAVFVIGVLVAGGVYVGLNLSKNKSITPQTTTQTQQVPNQTGINPTTAVSSPTPAQNTQTISMGGYGVYVKYTIVVPLTWQVEKTQNSNQDLLTLTSGSYQLQVNQFGGEVSQCVYGAATPSSPFAQLYTSYTELSYNGDASFYRRSKAQIPYPNGNTHYSICQKQADQSYSASTKFGVIDYMSPAANEDASVLSQMDTIVQSIQPQ